MTPTLVRWLLPLTTLAATAQPAVAQVRVFPMDGPRECTGLYFMSGDQHPGSFVIDYAAPAWQPEYLAIVDGTTPATVRLGRNFWTSLDSSLALDFGTETVPPGHYYLALSRVAAGEFRLLAFDAAALRARRLTPNDSELGAPRHSIPLALERSEEAQATLRITASSDPDDPTAGHLEIRWGTFRLWTAFETGRTSNRQNSFDAAILEMLALLDAGDHDPLIRRFADPDFIAKNAADLDELIRSFADHNKPDQLKRALLDVRRQAPTVGADQDEITVATEAGPGGSISLRHIDGRWYLLDR